MDQTQQELKDTTAAYAKLAMEKKLDEPFISTKIEEDSMWQMMQQAGIVVDDAQKEKFQKLMEENHTKRRKTTRPDKTCG